MRFVRKDGSNAKNPLSVTQAINVGSLVWESLSPCVTCGHLLRYTKGEGCVQCSKIKSSELYFADAPTPDNTYRVRKPCRSMGHPGVKWNGGKCYYCSDVKTPREQAREDGFDVYRPIHHCKRCKTLAERATVNGKCTNCYPLVRSTKSVSSEFMRNHPTTVISRSQAVKLGLKVYRTGRSCAYGHKGYRYVRNQNCLDCQKGVF